MYLGNIKEKTTINIIYNWKSEKASIYFTWIFTSNIFAVVDRLLCIVNVGTFTCSHIKG
jgi:hypothetical protein